MASVSLHQCQSIRGLGSGRFMLGRQRLLLAFCLFGGICAAGLLVLALMPGPIALWPPTAEQLLVVSLAGVAAMAAGLGGTRLTFDTVAGVVCWLHADATGIKREMLSSAQVSLVLRRRSLLGATGRKGQGYMLLLTGKTNKDKVLLARSQNLETIRAHAQRLGEQLQVRVRDFTR